MGATSEEPVDVRILSATHQNLESCVSAGKFRQDLYYRLNVIELVLPPLRQRLSDVPELASSILLKLASPGYQITLNQQAMAALQQYDFPGNVRELENILERAAAFANDGCIDVIDLGLRSSARHDMKPIALPASEAQELHEHLRIERHSAPSNLNEIALVEDASFVVEHNSDLPMPAAASVFLAPTLPCSLPQYLERIECEVIRSALKQTRNNRTQAAELLGVSFRQLRYSIQKLKINDVDAD